MRFIPCYPSPFLFLFFFSFLATWLNSPHLTCEVVKQTRDEIRGEMRGWKSLFIGSELISIAPISVLPAPLPLAVTQSSETDWLSAQRGGQHAPQNKHTHGQFSAQSLFIHLPSVCVSSRKDR